MLTYTASAQTRSLVLSALLFPALIASAITEIISGPSDVPTVSYVATPLSSDTELSGSVWLPEVVVLAEAPYGAPVVLPEVVVTAEAPYGTPVMLPEAVVVAAPFIEETLVAAGR